MTTPKRIIVVYNRYTQRGGEDEAYEAEADLLEAAGMEVRRLETTAVDPRGPLESFKAGVQITWNPAWRTRMRREIEEFQPDLIHAHNWFPNMSPSILWQARASGVPVVATLHNFRLMCVRATLYRDGEVCERCVGLKAALPGVLHSCYQSNRLRSAALAVGQRTHNALGTWGKCVDRFIVPSHFAREVFVRGGFPAASIKVKGNFLPFDPGAAKGPGAHMLFAGRLSEEKGIRALLRAAELTPVIKYVIAGNGPLEDLVRSSELPNVVFLGRLTRSRIMELIQDSRGVIIPSEWYEGFPLIAIEAFACGRPVIGSRIGAIAEGVEGGRTGVLFDPGDERTMASAIETVWNDPELGLRLGTHARSHFEKNFSPEKNLASLMNIYEEAFSTRSLRARS